MICIFTGMTKNYEWFCGILINGENNMDEVLNRKIADIVSDSNTGGSPRVSPVEIKSDIGVFDTQQEAEIKAKQVADSDKEDAVIIKEGNKFHVYSIDELNSKLKEQNYAGKIVESVPVFEFVATDPLTEQELILQKSDNKVDYTNLAITKYEEKYSKQMQKVLSSKHQAVIKQLKELENKIRTEHGIDVKIELSDDVFENKDKIEGFKYLLNYVYKNADELKARTIKTINVVDEWDNWWGYKLDLDYEKNKGRVLTIGDDFLDDWGESKNLNNKDSVKRIEKTLGKKLSEQELTNRSQTFIDTKLEFRELFAQLGDLQKSIDISPEEAKNKTKIVSDSLKQINDLLQKSKSEIEKLSIKEERKMSLDYLKTFEQIYSLADKEWKLFNKDFNSANPDNLSLMARTEKLKLMLLKEPEIAVEKRNYLGTYVSGSGSNIPGMGLTYERSFGREGNTTAYANLGYGSKNDSDDILFGVGVRHTFNSYNSVIDGAKVNVGIGTGAINPLFVGVSANNSWYLGNYKGLREQGSFVGGLYATVGTYNNAGVWVDYNKKLNDRVEVEGSADLSFLNQDIEAEAEVSLTKNKGVYLTGGVGTNKFLYAGVGFSDKYELEVGLGGISFGKDSNNLPGESSWELGIRTYLPFLPFFKHHTVPGCNFTYKDDSKEYISSKGVFILEKKVNGTITRQSFIPQVSPFKDTRAINYRIIKDKEDLKNTDKAKIRELSIGNLGYITVKDGNKTIIDDGRFMAPLSDAEVGIIVDQTGVLWYDKMKKRQNDTKQTVGVRRDDIPLPIFRFD